MRKNKLLLTLLCLWVGLMPAMAQSATIINEMQKVPYANVMAMYKNEFGSFEKPAMSITFPYAVIRMHLEGNAHEVRAAKERLTLYMGQQMGVEARVTTYSNQILFLVRAPRHPMIHIDCGDGCDQVLLSNMQQLQPNCLYDCTVRFRLEGDINATTDTVFVNEGPQYHTLNLHVEPADAKVEVFANGEYRNWILEDGQISLQLLEGDYDYTISANRYYTEKGTIHIPNNQTDTTIRLRCMMGWLSITSDSTNLQNLSAKISRSDGSQIVSLPCERFLCYPAKYTITIKSDYFYTYKQDIIIEENAEVHLSPKLVPKGSIPDVSPVYATDIIDNFALIHGKLPDRYIAETGIIYGKMKDYTQGQRVVLTGEGEFEKGLTDLEPDTEYFVWAYAYNGIDTVYSTIDTFKTLQAPIEKGYRYADLGLSVKWATCNIGANSPEEYGDYFAWGETKPKSTYSWNTYIWCEGSPDSQTKYCSSRLYGIVDNKKQLELSDDAAIENWGGTWRMPTDAEWAELEEKCTWKWTTQNGVKGYKVTSKINDNSIFLPAAGYKGHSGLYELGSYCYYWLGVLGTNYPSDAYGMCLSSSSIRRDNYSRNNGFSIRPVCQ